MVQRCHSEKNKKNGWWLVFTGRWDLPSSCMVGIFPTYIIYIHIWMDFFKEKKGLVGPLSLNGPVINGILFWKSGEDC